MEIRPNYRSLIFVLVITLIAVYLVLPNTPGLGFLGVTHKVKTYLGLDLIGGIQVLLEADIPPGSSAPQNLEEAMQTARRIVENRVNGLGVNEAVVQLAGTNRIVVELPGIEDPEAAVATIKGTALLEFVDMSAISQEQAIALVGSRILTSLDTPETISATLASTNTLLIPGLSDRVWQTQLTGADLKNAGVTTNRLNQYEVALEFTPEGAQKFAAYTAANIGKVLAIVLDKQVLSVPTIQNTITDGQAVITGQFTYDEANNLAIQLRYGALPIPLKVVESRTIGPTLGQDSLNKSVVAWSIGLTIVMLFMGIYYRLPGVIADISIVIYALVTFALFRSIPVTLTLAGIAGLMLSTGSALDANILIFERLKEELRSGRALSNALDLAWRRAWPSIRDSNIAAIITSLILLWFGSSFGATIVQGFAVTLLLGVLVSLFSAIVATRALLQLALAWFKPTNLSRWFGL